MFELVLFCYIWVSGMFYPINDINYGVIALVASIKSPPFFFFFQIDFHTMCKLCCIRATYVSCVVKERVDKIMFFLSEIQWASKAK